jgi:hypothetical protein
VPARLSHSGGGLNTKIKDAPVRKVIVFQTLSFNTIIKRLLLKNLQSIVPLTTWHYFFRSSQSEGKRQKSKVKSQNSKVKSQRGKSQKTKCQNSAVTSLQGAQG